MSISVKLEAFEGPLDLLLHLIDKNKVNIYDIPIIEITKQYLDYIQEMETKDLDSISDFLVMASTLINIKSKMLLPKEEEAESEEDPRTELVERLLEYKMFKYISGILKDKEILASKVLYKEPTIPHEVKTFKEEVDPAKLLTDVTLGKIQKTFVYLMKKQEDKIDPIRSKFGEIKQEQISLEDKIIDIRNYASSHEVFSFTQLLSDQATKTEFIVTFLGVLELIKSGQVIVDQESLFDDIIIRNTDRNKYIRQEPPEAVLNGI